jgi:TonB family protein
MRILFLIILIFIFIINTLKSQSLDKDPYINPETDSLSEWPQYRGGKNELNKFLSSNIKYPVESAVKGIEGKVLVGFTVDKTGEIVDVKILKSVDLLLDREAERVIRMMPRWIPGKNKGVVVRTKHQVGIVFTLSETGGYIQNLTFDSTACDVYPTFGNTPFAFQQSARLILVAQGPPAKAGYAIITFTITKDNELLDITVVKSTDPLLEEDALNVIRKLRGTWKAGLRKGKPVDVRCQADFVFIL